MPGRKGRKTRSSPGSGSIAPLATRPATPTRVNSIRSTGDQVCLISKASSKNWIWRFKRHGTKRINGIGLRLKYCPARIRRRIAKLSPKPSIAYWLGRKKTDVMNESPLRYGYGRLDAVGHILNKILMFTGADETKGNPANAPVSYPFLWNIWRAGACAVEWRRLQ